MTRNNYLRDMHAYMAVGPGAGGGGPQAGGGAAAGGVAAGALAVPVAVLPLAGQPGPVIDLDDEDDNAAIVSEDEAQDIVLQADGFQI